MAASLQYIEETLKHLSRSHFAPPHTKSFESKISSQKLKKFRHKTDED
jgi:hypothetical protein